MKAIGILNSGSPETLGEQFVAFHRGLEEAGYVDGQNVTTVYRWCYDDYKRGDLRKLEALAAELVKLPVAVLVAAGGPVSALAAKAVVKRTPIVFTTVTDPVKSGLVKSLEKPGGKLTGTAGLTSELDAARLELLHELDPKADAIGVIVNANRPGDNPNKLSDDLTAKAADLRVKLVRLPAGANGDVATAFKAVAKQKVKALLVAADPLFNSRRAEVVALAAERKLPAIYQWRGFAVAGGLMSYGPSIAEAYHQAGVYAGRILDGAEPADLPVMVPTKFELVINLEAAEKLRLTIPPKLIARATLLRRH
jgi:putative tryptophan/tyrosine transport system substrate-binding protein